MSQTIKENSFFDSPIFGHPKSLFVLFFTEMWERFSYYGMRALFVMFLISSSGIGGWDWTSAQALSLYGTYISMVYLTPILGGFLADKYLGSRKAVIIGAVIMTLGHISMALEFHKIFMFIGVGCLIIGNGFFKPNMTSMISSMYKDFPEKKDGAYTIFYMGVNAGSFLGIMLCGYLGEQIGWSYGFGLAGIFMLLGMIQFYFSQNIFGKIGEKPLKSEKKEVALEFEGDKLNPFTTFDRILIIISLALGLAWIINDPMSAIANAGFLTVSGIDISNYVILTATLSFIVLLISRIIRYPNITKNRMSVIVTFAFFIILYNASFEQAGGSMTIFAKNYTDRILEGSAATGFIIMDIIITTVPILLITWVLFLLIKRIYKTYLISTIVLIVSFLCIWGIVGWMIQRNLTMQSYEVQYHTYEKEGEDGVKSSSILTTDLENQINKEDLMETKTTIRETRDFKLGEKVKIMDLNGKGNFKYMPEEKHDKIEKSRLVTASVHRVKEKELEVNATWFGILNSLFIIMFAPLFSKWWGSRFNPAASVKYGLGLILVGLGFAALALGSSSIPKGAETASVSMIWLVIAYMLHTFGELCMSPVSLSYVSKLVPGRMIALMYGIWYIALAIGNKLAGKLGGQIEKIQEEYSISFFFMIFTIFLVFVGIIAILIRPGIKKLMHGVK